MLKIFQAISIGYQVLKKLEELLTVGTTVSFPLSIKGNVYAVTISVVPQAELARANRQLLEQRS